MGIRNFFRHGGAIAWGLIGAVVLLLGLSSALLAETAKVRFRRDITRLVFNDNLEVLESIRKEVGAQSDSLDQLLEASPEVPRDKPYLVISIADRRLWYKQGTETLYETRVAVGSGKTLVKGPGGNTWKFDTPRGRLVVQNKEVDPVWVPPDWHFVEQARNRGLGLRRLSRNEEIPLEDGSAIAVSGGDVVKRLPDGREIPFEGREGREIIAGGNIVIPPFGTNQRKYEGVLGTHRLNLGDGYALHGTDKPESIGQAVSHGCVRLRNEDIETLYRMVEVGTPVYIY
jgi:lipoprotein-anchoring transpeptidase ErfK/SrfK